MSNTDKKTAEKSMKDAEQKALKEAKDAEQKALKEAKDAEKKALKEANDAEKKALKEAKDAEKKALKAAKIAKDAEEKAMKNLQETNIPETTEFYEANKTLLINKDWICCGIPCYIITKTDEKIKFKPFNRSGVFVMSVEEFMAQFTKLERDSEFVYTNKYPCGQIKISEFTISKISDNEIKKHFSADKNFSRALDKVFQDAYTSKGNSFCIKIDGYKKYQLDKVSSKLERIGDPIFNRSTRHTVPIPSTYLREEFEKHPSFPAPIGIRKEDFALPSEQNDILRELLTQLFNSANAPDCPINIQQKYGFTVLKNSHICNWCGVLMDINELNQEYCSKEHTINFCHRDPVIGTRPGNVYIGHCSCNREQGGYSEIQRIEQAIRLMKFNPLYKEFVLSQLQ